MLSIGIILIIVDILKRIGFQHITSRKEDYTELKDVDVDDDDDNDDDDKVKLKELKKKKKFTLE